MGCGCGGKPSSRNIIKGNGTGSGNSTTTDGYKLPSYSTDIIDSKPSEWGPLFWNALHTLANKVGRSNNRQVDIDQGLLFRSLLMILPNILPCQQCQEHAREYMLTTIVPELDAYRGISLNIAVQEYIFNFHNAVRTRLGQTIIMNTFNECDLFYKSQLMSYDKISAMNPYGLYGVNQGWISMDSWKLFMNTMDRIRLLSS